MISWKNIATALASVLLLVVAGLTTWTLVSVNHLQQEVARIEEHLGMQQAEADLENGNNITSRK